LSATPSPPPPWGMPGVTGCCGGATGGGGATVGGVTTAGGAVVGDVGGTVTGGTAGRVAVGGVAVGGCAAGGNFCASRRKYPKSGQRLRRFRRPRPHHQAGRRIGLESVCSHVSPYGFRAAAGGERHRKQTADTGLRRRTVLGLPSLCMRRHVIASTHSKMKSMEPGRIPRYRVVAYRGSPFVPASSRSSSPWLRSGAPNMLAVAPLIGSAAATRHPITMATTTRHTGLDGCSTRRMLRGPTAIQAPVHRGHRWQGRCRAIPRGAGPY
jgi:hypothetical protein